jgi:hypothetical protein
VRAAFNQAKAIRRKLIPLHEFQPDASAEHTRSLEDRVQLNPVVLRIEDAIQLAARQGLA